MTYSNNVFCLRHLKTKYNRLHVITGQSNSDIVETKTISIDLNNLKEIYCSPSLRCVKTLQILGGLSFDANRILYDERLLERNMGCLEGMRKSEAEEKYPDLFYGGRFDLFKTPPLGESFAFFSERVNYFYRECIESTMESGLLISSHNQTLKLLRLFILNKKITYQSWEEYSFDNGIVYNVRETKF